MENISIAIKALFSKVSGDEILKLAGFIFNDEVKKEDADDIIHIDSKIQESMVVNRLLKVDRERSIDQISMLEQIIQDKWMTKERLCQTMRFRETDSVFNVLLYFASKCLMVKNGNPICQYSYLLRWHTLTTLLGEDLLTTSFLASRDIAMNFQRTSFDWDAYIGHNSKELNYLFEKPMAELHMHLNGSSFNYDLSWQCMMNRIGDMRPNFEKDYPRLLS